MPEENGYAIKNARNKWLRNQTGINNAKKSVAQKTK